MAQRVAWGQRRALGRRYSVDPAYELASEEQAQQLALASQRDARALQASQFEKSLAFNQEQADLNRASSEKAGITGTVGNLATTAALGYFMKGGGSSTGALTSGGYSPAAVNAAGFATPAQEAAITAATNQGLYNATTGGVNYVSPALTDSSLVAADGAGSIGTASGASASGAGTGASSGASTAIGYATPAAIVAGAELVRGKFGQLDRGWEEKSFAGKATSAPATMGVLAQLAPGLAFKDNDNKFVREMARAEQQVMKPIEVVMDWIGSWF